MKQYKQKPLDDLPFSKARTTRRTIVDEPIAKPIDKDEARLQTQCEEYLEIQKIPYLHIPNQAFQGKRTVASKYLKGWPDLMIFKRIIHNVVDHLTLLDEYNYTLFIELKTAKGKVTQGQENRAKMLNVKIVRSLDDFIKAVEGFIGRNF